MDEKDGDAHLKIYIKPLSNDLAFTKGVDYFAEISFFYCFMFGLTIHKIRKSAKSAESGDKSMDETWATVRR